MYGSLVPESGRLKLQSSPAATWTLVPWWLHSFLELDLVLDFEALELKDSNRFTAARATLGAVSPN
jgi:hypothetical protein